MLSYVAEFVKTFSADRCLNSFGIPLRMPLSPTLNETRPTESRNIEILTKAPPDLLLLRIKRNNIPAY